MALVGELSVGLRGPSLQVFADWQGWLLEQFEAGVDVLGLTGDRFVLVDHPGEVMEAAAGVASMVLVNVAWLRARIEERRGAAVAARLGLAAS